MQKYIPAPVSRIASSTLLPVLLVSLVGLPATVINAAEQDFRGQKIVHLLQEPRHRTVFTTGSVYLLDVQVNPGDASFPHTHDAPILVTAISAGSGPSNGRVSSNTDYAKQNYTHAISNPGPGLMRLIALTTYGEEKPDTSSDRPVGMGVEPQLENGWFRSYRLTLAPGQVTETQTHSNISFVVQVTDGKVHVSREDGITAELTAMGDWAERDPGSSYRIQNVGTEPVDVVVNEARN